MANKIYLTWVVKLGEESVVFIPPTKPGEKITRVAVVPDMYLGRRVFVTVLWGNGREGEAVEIYGKRYATALRYRGYKRSTSEIASDSRTCDYLKGDAPVAAKAATFEQAWHDMPSCVDTDPLSMRTLDDLRWACQIQLDLIEEGQDGTEEDDPEAIRRWLKKYGRL